MNTKTTLLALAGAALGGTAFAEQTPAAWSAQNADEVRAVVAEMLADAETRSSLLQSGATAGYDKNFFIASADGNFRLNVSGQVQFRYVVNWRDTPNNAPADFDDFEQGFQTRRTKLRFEGHVFDPNLYYGVVANFDRDGGPFGGGDDGLEEAFVGYRFDNGFITQWGQFAVPFYREFNVSDRYMLAVERSLVNEAFNQDYSQGAMVGYEAEQWRVFFSASDGFGSRNTDLLADPADYALTFRGEWAIAGDWQQFRDFTSPRGSNFGMLLGAAAHFEDTPDFPGNNNVETLLYTLDLSVEGDGWNLAGIFLGTHQKSDVPAAGFVNDETQDFAFIVQGGLYLTDQFEIFARYEAIIPDSDRGDADPAIVGSGEEMFSAITGGFNYYFHSHAAKFTLDVLYFIDEASENAYTAGGDPDNFGPRSNGPLRNVGFPGNTGVGFLGGGDEELTFRAQFQLLF